MRIKGLFILIALLLSSIGMAEGTPRFVNALRIRRERAAVNAARVAEFMRLSYEQNNLHPSLRQSLNDLLGNVREMKQEIEAGAREMTDQEYESFLAASFSYYVLQDRLFMANHSLHGQVQTVSAQELRLLRLVVPTPLAHRVQAGLAAANVQRRLPPFYTALVIEPVEGRPELSYLEYGPDMRRRFMMQSFAAYPSERMAHDTLRLTGLSLSFAQYAKIQSFLYLEERSDIHLPEHLSADDRSFIQLLQEDAFNVANENNYRPRFRDHVVAVMSDMVQLKTHDYDHPTQYEQDLVALLPAILAAFPSHVDPQKANNSHAQSIVRYAQWRGRVFFHELYAKITASPTYFHLLEGEALIRALKDLAIGVEKEQLLFMIGCRYFSDAAGETSLCRRGGTQPPRIFEISNQWTLDEINRLNSMVQVMLERNYGTIPDSLIQQLRHLRRTLDSVGIARRRYQSAALIIDGSKTLGRIDEMFREIGQTTENTVNSDYLADPDVMGNLILPGRVILAAAHTGYLDPNRPSYVGFDASQDPYKPWVSQILSKIVVKATGSEVSQQERERYGQSLGVLPVPARNVTTIFDDFSSRFRDISMPLLAGSHVNLSNDQMRRDENRSCNGFFAFVTCFDVWRSRFAAFTTDLSSAALNPSARRMVIRNGALDEVYGIYSAQQAGSFRSIDERLQDMRQELTENSHTANAAAVQFVDAFLSLLNFADEYTYESELRVQIQGVFDALMTAGEEADVLPLVRLIMDVDRFKALVTNQGPFHEMLEASFAAPEERNRLLWPFLQKKAVFVEYLKIMVQDLEDNMPSLFFEMPLHSEVAAVAGNHHNVPLYKVVNGLKGVANSPVVVGPIATAMQSLNEDNTQRSTESLNEVKVHQLPMMSLLGDAAGILTDQSSFSLTLYRRWWGAADGPANDAWWPRDLKARDLLPAIRDQYLLEGCQRQQDPSLCRRQAKIHRILVTAFLKPYYSSAAYAKKRSIERLADPRQNFDRAMLQSQGGVIKAIHDAVGDQGNSGIDGLNSKVMYWDNWLTTAQDQLRSINRQLFGFMMTSQTAGISQSFNARVNRLMGWSMLIPSVGELAVQGALARQYYLNYLSLAPFAMSGMTTGSLIEGRDLRRALDKFHGELDTIARTVPMTAVFTISIASNAFVPEVPGSGPDRGPTRGHYEGNAGPGGRIRTDHEVLGVPEGETDVNVIRRAYRQGVARYHPDRNPHPDSAAAFNELQSSYERLMASLGHARPVQGPRDESARPGEARRQDYDLLRVRHNERNPRTVQEAFLAETEATTGDTPQARARRVELDGAYRRVMAQIETEAAQAAAATAQNQSTQQRPNTGAGTTTSPRNSNPTPRAQAPSQPQAPSRARRFFQRFFSRPFNRTSGPTGELNQQQQQAMWDLDIPTGVNRSSAEGIHRSLQQEVMDAQLRNQAQTTRIQTRITELRTRLTAARPTNPTLEDDPDFIRLNLEQAEADLLAEQNRATLLRAARTRVDAAWQQAQSYYQSAGSRSVSPMFAQSPQFNDWNEGMQELGVEAGEAFADAQRRYVSRLNQVPGYAAGEADPAQVQRVHQAWTKTQSYYNRLNEWGLSHNDLRAPVWITRQAVTPEARQVEGSHSRTGTH